MRKNIFLKQFKDAIMTAASAPSGANQQPWTFVVVEDKHLKHQIRVAAEKEEKSFYQQRAPNEWLEKVAPLGTDWRKPFLEDAPYLIIVFKQIYGIENDLRVKHYYVDESVGIAVGFLLTAIHQTGLVALPHTPSPMGFLSQILKRPANERAFLLIPVGYPKETAQVPEIIQGIYYLDTANFTHLKNHRQHTELLCLVDQALKTSTAILLRKPIILCYFNPN